MKSITTVNGVSKTVKIKNGDDSFAAVDSAICMQKCVTVFFIYFCCKFDVSMLC